MTAQAEQMPDVSAQLLQMLTGKWVSQIICTVAKLGIADHIAAGNKAAEELARDTATHAPSLHRLLRAAVSLGVFEESADGRFCNNTFSSALRSDSPSAMRDMAIFIGDSPSWAAWGDLLYSVQTGKSAFERLHGAFPFAYMKDHPELGERFHRAMVAFTLQEMDALLEVMDFSGIGSLCDVGGGEGAVLARVLKRYPHMRGVLFDLEPVTRAARGYLAREGLESRCEFVAGDFFEKVPDGVDAYVMKHVLHDWGDEDALRIVQTIADAAVPGTRLILFDNLLGTGQGSDFCKLLDLELLVLFDQGRERTREEYADILGRAGFQLQRVRPTRSLLNVIEAVRA